MGIVITLPDDIYQRAKRFAQLANRDIASVLADTIQHSIPPVSLDVLGLQPVADLPNEPDDEPLTSPLPLNERLRRAPRLIPYCDSLDLKTIEILLSFSIGFVFFEVPRIIAI